MAKRGLLKGVTGHWRTKTVQYTVRTPPPESFRQLFAAKLVFGKQIPRRVFYLLPELSRKDFIYWHMDRSRPYGIEKASRILLSWLEDHSQ